MARSDLVRRTQEAAWRSAGKQPETVTRSFYEDDMSKLGKNRAPIYDGEHATRRIEGLGDFLTHPISVTILCIATFALVFAALLWREGKLNWPFAPQGAMMEQGKKWMKGLPADALDTLPLPSSGAEDAPIPNEVEAQFEQDRLKAESDAAARAAAFLAAEAEIEAAQAQALAE